MIVEFLAVVSILLPLLWIGQYSRQSWMMIALGQFEWVSPGDNLRLHFYIAPDSTNAILVIETAGQTRFFYEVIYMEEPTLLSVCVLWAFGVGTTPPILIRPLIPNRVHINFREEVLIFKSQRTRKRILYVFDTLENSSLRAIFYG